MSIKSERVKSGKSIEEVCKFMGVSRTTWYKWESGKGNPRAAKLLKLAAYLGCTVDSLLIESQ